MHLSPAGVSLADVTIGSATAEADATRAPRRIRRQEPEIERAGGRSGGRAKLISILRILALPTLRPLRLLRVLTLLRVLNRGATDSLRGRVAVYVAGSTVLVLFCGGLAVLSAERGHAGSNIQNFGDAVWWATVTMATVGYGDHFPVTGEGRFVGVGLMLAGVGLLGIVTASLASWLIDQVRAVDEAEQQITRHDIQSLRVELRELRAELRDARSSTPREAGTS